MDGSWPIYLHERLKRCPSILFSYYFHLFFVCKNVSLEYLGSLEYGGRFTVDITIDKIISRGRKPKLIDTHRLTIKRIMARQHTTTAAKVTAELNISLDKTVEGTWYSSIYHRSLLFPTNGRTYVWRLPNHAYDRGCLLTTV